jgi:hypothetical protein
MEMLGDVGEFAFESGEPGTEWRPVCVAWSVVAASVSGYW